jgi:hypothetical protein
VLPIIGSKGSKFNKKVKEAQEVARINYFGTSQLKYKLKVEAVSLYFKSSNIGKLFPTSGIVIFPHWCIHASANILPRKAPIHKGFCSLFESRS